MGRLMLCNNPSVSNGNAMYFQTLIPKFPDEKLGANGKWHKPKRPNGKWQMANGKWPMANAKHPPLASLWDRGNSMPRNSSALVVRDEVEFARGVTATGHVYDRENVTRELVVVVCAFVVWGGANLSAKKRDTFSISTDFTRWQKEASGQQRKEKWYGNRRTENPR